MVRAVRIERRLRQSDLATRAGVGRTTVSRIERGLLDGVTVRTLRALSRALDMPPIIDLGWRGAETARLLDEGHAAVVDDVLSTLGGCGWETSVEYTFSHYGERGSVDIVAWHPETQTLLIIEVKTLIVDMQDLLGTMHRKQRIVPMLLARERGWNPRAVGLALVVPDTSTIRQAIARHSATFDSALPARTDAMRGWLVSPDGPIAGILFMPTERQEPMRFRRRSRRRQSGARRGRRSAVDANMQSRVAGTDQSSIVAAAQDSPTS